jgi:hypothetical protein
MTEEERMISREARRRFGQFTPGDPRGILADIPIHFQTEPATADVRRAVKSMADAYAARRQKAQENLAAAEAATLEYNRKLELERAKGEQERQTALATGEQQRLTEAAKPQAERKAYEAGGFLFEPKLGGGYTKSRAMYRPSTFVSYADRVTPEQLESARRAAISDVTANLGKYLGTITIRKGQQMVDERGQPVWTTDIGGRKIPYLAQIDTEVQRGISSLSPAAQELHQRGAAIVGAKAAREITAADAVRALDALVGTSMPIDARQVYMGLKEYLNTPQGLQEMVRRQDTDAMSNEQWLQTLTPEERAALGL